MRKEIPTWVAALVIVVVIVVVAFVYYFATSIRREVGPTSPEFKAKMQQYFPKIKKIQEMEGQTPATP